MSSRYTGDGRRKSSMTHAKRGHTCDFCGRVVFGNGGEVSHARAHVKRGEAVELTKPRVYDYGISRIFLAADDTERIQRFLADGYGVA